MFIEWKKDKYCVCQTKGTWIYNCFCWNFFYAFKLGIWKQWPSMESHTYTMYIRIDYWNSKQKTVSPHDLLSMEYVIYFTYEMWVSHLFIAKTKIVADWSKDYCLLIKSFNNNLSLIIFFYYEMYTTNSYIYQQKKYSGCVIDLF